MTLGGISYQLKSCLAPAGSEACRSGELLQGVFTFANGPPRAGDGPDQIKASPVSGWRLIQLDVMLETHFYTLINKVFFTEEPFGVP